MAGLLSGALLRCWKESGILGIPVHHYKDPIVSSLMSKPTMKSIGTLSHGLLGIGRGFRSLVGALA